MAAAAIPIAAASVTRAATIQKTKPSAAEMTGPATRKTELT
jgi:hypothetical protein